MVTILRLQLEKKTLNNKDKPLKSKLKCLKKMIAKNRILDGLNLISELIGIHIMYILHIKIVEK